MVKKSKTSKLNAKKNQLVNQIKKRDGKIVPFEVEKITNAIFKAMISTGEGDMEDAELVSAKVHAEIVRIVRTFKDIIPTVEGVQDIVEQQLILSNYVKTAKHYILYREERAKIRSQKQIQIPDRIRKLAQESKKYFRNSLSEFVYYRTYARWIESENRRETWIETVDRYISFMKENLGTKLKESEYAEIRQAILEQKVMPSMRLMQFAGPAARKTNVCCYNCSYISPSKITDFAEIMYVSMCGTGVGFSVESPSVQQLPQIKKQTGKKLKTHIVADSKEGWCDALTAGLSAWFDGHDIDFDFSLVRPEGARLKIMGGKASGPAPLKQLLEFARGKILAKQGRRLSNIDVHDICCMIGQIVVVGGVRRSAMISLSDLDDTDMRDAKAGQFWNTAPQRVMANNSAIYEQKPTTAEFMEEWLALIKSGSGERGIFNRGSLDTQLPERRVKKIGQNHAWGTNPCGEIVLKSKQFCNLSEVVCRSEDNEKTLMEKIRLATILGTYQASLTNFGYLSKEWKENCEQEALLGVSLTGQWDCEVVRNDKVLQKLKKESIRINKIYAKKFGINESTCITTTKPSGTVSQVVDSASGMHPRYAKYYIRRIRIGRTDSLFRMLKDQAVPYHPEVGFSEETASTFVIEFPVKAPDNAIVKDSVSAIDQLEHWKLVKTNYTEHNPSVTVSVGEDEWLRVGNWIYENWENVGGLSFLPRTDHVYQLAPYEEIDKAKYDEMLKKFENIDFSKILAYEQVDETNLKQELACAGGVCEVDDIVKK
ncbi:MAG TPA: ATP cone domain-containing protein [Candidatus Paceibacterota bacterium]|nr:ATP cone domain-containing protein [Candidatus Paceibacterota bacterium]HMP19252.1 ATP cone domain-containing protein [Candidatus Paceibacterota bacterium]HMP85533.1 ATP cone domain-containing protein [Candidatus Paceibacterota bacterium]